jgi:DNA repair exonuclease SbcCD nuclease subunit
LSRPYGLIADLHLHAWKSFSRVDDDGVNSRLKILLKEIKRVAKTVAEAGGDTVVIAGDVFHVRGQVAPSVLIPTRDVLIDIAGALGIRFIIMPGNHDMEFKESARLGNAISALEERGLVEVTDENFIGNEFVLIPWHESVETLKANLKLSVAKDPAKTDLILHAPINGVITGIPDHGLDPTYLAGLGFRRVFAGHYHNHKEFAGGVYSIGALAHHTWSDIGTRAGFLLVYPDKVVYQASHAPEFIEILPEMDEDEVALRVPGNYVRAKTHCTKAAELNELRDYLVKQGAAGVLIQHVPAPVTTRDGTVARAASGVGGSLEASIGAFIDGASYIDADQRTAVSKHCQAILAEAAVV